MKILHIAPLTGNKSSGLYYSIPKLVENQNEINGITSEILNSSLINNENSHLGLFKTSFNSDKEFLEYFLGFDIYIFHSNYIYEHVKLYKLIKKYNKKYIITPRGGFTILSRRKKKFKKMIFGNLIFKKYFQNADGYHYLSQREMEKSVYRGQNEMVIPNGVSIKNGSFSNSKEKMNIVYVGRMDVYTKGLDLLLKTLAKFKADLKKNNIVFNCYGPVNKSDSKYIYNQIDNNDLTEIIKFHDPVYGKEKSEIYNESNAFIQLSRYEGFSMGILEALNNRLPCILTKGTNLSEEVEKYNVGVEVSGNEESIFNGIMRIKSSIENDLLKDTQFRKLLSNYEWKSIAEQTIDFYSNVLKQ